LKIRWRRQLRCRRGLPLRFRHRIVYNADARFQDEAAHVVYLPCESEARRLVRRRKAALVLRRRALDTAWRKVRGLSRGDVRRG
jgi:hypothetical protein